MASARWTARWCRRARTDCHERRSVARIPPMREHGATVAKRQEPPRGYLVASGVVAVSVALDRTPPTCVELLGAGTLIALPSAAGSHACEFRAISSVRLLRSRPDCCDWACSVSQPALQEAYLQQLRSCRAVRARRGLQRASFARRTLRTLGAQAARPSRCCAAGDPRGSGHQCSGSDGQASASARKWCSEKA
jgi:hypothetical protein